MTRSHVFFDLDGTLTDPEPGIVASIRHAMTSLGREPWPAARLRGLIGPPLTEVMRRIFESDDEALVEQAIRHYRERFVIQGMFENRVYPGIPRALSELQSHEVSLAVATSKPQMFADRIIDHFELRQYFSGIYGADLGGARADKADVLALALDGEGLSGQQRERALMVGDRRHDIEGAKAQQMRSVGVLWGYGTLQELGASRPDRIVIDVDDLASVLLELLASTG